MLCLSTYPFVCCLPFAYLQLCTFIQNGDGQCSCRCCNRGTTKSSSIASSSSTVDYVACPQDMYIFSITKGKKSVYLLVFCVSFSLIIVVVFLCLFLFSAQFVSSICSKRKFSPQITPTKAKVKSKILLLIKWELFLSKNYIILSINIHLCYFSFEFQ